MKHPFVFIILLLLSFNLSAQIHATLALPNPCASADIVNPLTAQNSFYVVISPNPSQGDFSLSISSDKILGELTLEIFNVQGKRLHIEKFLSSSPYCIKSVNGLSIPAGLYYITVCNDFYRVTQSAVVYKH